MTGNELRSLRQRLGLTPSELGRALGYTGNQNTVRTYMRRLELMREASVPPQVAGRVEMYGLRERAGPAPLKART